MKKSTKTTPVTTTEKVELTKDEQIRFALQMYVRRNEIDIEKGKAEMMDDFLYRMAWNAEDLYKKIYVTNYYKSMLTDMMEHSVERVMQEWIKRMENYISQSYNVRENCTGAMHREVSTWKFVCQMEMLEWLKGIQK